MNDDDQRSNGEGKNDDGDEEDESEDGVFGLTTVIDLKKHQVNVWECHWKFSDHLRFRKLMYLFMSKYDTEH